MERPFDLVVLLVLEFLTVLPLELVTDLVLVLRMVLTPFLVYP